MSVFCLPTVGVVSISCWTSVLSVYCRLTNKNPHLFIALNVGVFQHNNYRQVNCHDLKNEGARSRWVGVKGTNEAENFVKLLKQIKLKLRLKIYLKITHLKSIFAPFFRKIKRVSFVAIIWP